MKNLVTIVIVFITIFTNAQERKKDGPHGDMKERMEMRQEMTPEETATLQTKKMTLQLDLTENQQVEIKNIFLADAKVRKSKMEEFKANKEKAEGEKLSKEEYVKMQNERLDHQIEFKKKMKSILNADQYAKFEKMQESRGKKRGDHMKLRKKND